MIQAQAPQVYSCLSFHVNHLFRQLRFLGLNLPHHLFKISLSFFLHARPLKSSRVLQVFHHPRTFNLMVRLLIAFTESYFFALRKKLKHSSQQPRIIQNKFQHQMQLRFQFFMKVQFLFLQDQQEKCQLKMSYLHKNVNSFMIDFILKQTQNLLHMKYQVKSSELNL